MFLTWTQDECKRYLNDLQYRLVLWRNDMTGEWIASAKRGRQVFYESEAGSKMQAIKSLCAIVAQGTQGGE